MPLPVANFDPANSIFSGKSIIQLVVSPNVTGVTAVATTEVFTKTAHGFKTGDVLKYVSGTGFTGLTAGTTYLVSKIDADTFKLSANRTALVAGTFVDITEDGSAGVFTPIFICETKMLTDSEDSELKHMDWPDSSGTLRKVRSVRSKSQESWKFESPEIRRLPSLFNGALKGMRNGTCTLWIPDPSDASGKCALKSEADFTCIVRRDGDLSFGGQDYANATLVIESLKAGDVTWSVDGDA